MPVDSLDAPKKRRIKPINGSLNDPKLLDKFWKKVRRGDPNSCWIWLAGKDQQGYGAFRVRCVYHRAHRVAYTIAKGPIPDGMVVMHSCDTPSCVNPAHLSVGTDADNVRDMHKKGRNAIPFFVANPDAFRGENHWMRRFPNRVKRAEECKHSKLKWFEVEEIRCRHARGDRLSHIAEAYSIDDKHVGDLVRFRTWKI